MNRPFFPLMMLVGGLFLPLGPSASAQEPGASGEGHDRTYSFVWKSADRGYLGLQVSPMTPELRAYFGAPEDEGVLVAKVREGSPAAASGVLVGDIVTAVEGEAIPSPARLAHAIGGKRAGDVVSVELWRDGAPQTLSVTVAERDRRVMDLAAVPDFDVFVTAPGIPLDVEASEALEEARRELLERFDSEEWQRKLERLSELNLSRVEERMRELEKRLRELESELERAARERERL